MGELTSDKDAIFSLLNYEPTPLQREIHSSTAKYRIVACGSRWGKSFVAAHEAIAELFRPGSLGWIVVPYHSLGDEIFTKLIVPRVETYAPQGFIKNMSVRDRYLRTAIDSEIQVKSADNYRALKGASLDWAIIDEAAEVDEQAYDYVRIRLADKGGWFLAISTPVGRNWFERAYLRGQDRKRNPEWQSWNAPSSSNPYFPSWEFDELKRTMPDRRFRQEILAEFLDDDGRVFTNVEACAKGAEAPPAPGRQYVVAWDIARHQDASVATVWDVRNKAVVKMDRFRWSWDAQITFIKELARRYNRADIVADATGQGDAIVDRLANENLAEGFSRRVVPISMYDAKVKRSLIEALALAMEKEEISYPPYDMLLKELKQYEYETKPKSGLVSYHAPRGEHDDCVMSLALGWHLVNRSQGTLFLRTGTA